MPGILPMKIIRVGSSSQSRIAQACDRCRSKKIRCDGVRPCCTQCANVGFECKTSDKLSRRAFPRGYTESLEDRVRGLETEVRELKALLDEKDEKIDMLSRIHNFSPRSRKISLTPDTPLQVKAEDASPQEDVISVEIPAAVQPATSATGTPTTAALIEAFEEKIRDNNHNCPIISSATLLKPQYLTCKTTTAHSSPNTSPAPPRLLSDQYINLYFQEWQPLLPILHRSTFLRVYEQFLSEADSSSSQGDKASTAQLFLIFEIAAHSSSSKSKPATSAYETQWRKALSAASSTPSIQTLQSHLLALLCCLLKADCPHLLRHRAHAVSMAHQLCLHQGHKNHSLPVFEAETRRKVFWCLYVLDKFASAATGTPQLLRDSDISAEYPADVDDENISSQGFSPTLPGEITKMSSALALFRMSRILAKTLECLYPATASYRLSLTKLHSLSDELDQWQEELPAHLRLRFCNDKPATNLISCRSPLLSLGYFYTRSLIHRPLLCHGSASAVSAATIVLAAASKHELQIIDLLDERSMNYTFPLNKQDLLIGAGFSILWQTIGLEEDSKLIRDNQKSLVLMLNKLSKESSAATATLQKIAHSFVSVSSTRLSPNIVSDVPGAAATSSTTSTAVAKPRSARKQLQAIASRMSSFHGKSRSEDGDRHTNSSQSGPYQLSNPGGRANSSASLSSTRSAPVLPTPPIITMTPGLSSASGVNLDYFPLTDDAPMSISNNSSSTMLPPKKVSPSIGNSPSWEQFTGINGDPGSPEMFRTISPAALNRPVSVIGVSSDWSSDLWQISACDMAPRTSIAQSPLSFSEESLTSGDDLLFSASGSHNGSVGNRDSIELPNVSHTSTDEFKGITVPIDDVDEFVFQSIAV